MIFFGRAAAGALSRAHVGSARRATSGTKRRLMPWPAPGSVTARAKKARSTTNGMGMRILLSRPMELDPLTTPRQTTHITKK
jgi:hypothetical protein